MESIELQVIMRNFTKNELQGTTKEEFVSTMAKELVKQFSKHSTKGNSQAYTAYELKKQEGLSKELRASLEKDKKYYEERMHIAWKYQKQREELEQKGAAPEVFSFIDKEEEKALKELDIEIASREKTFQELTEKITSFSLEQLQKLLYDATQELERIEFINPKSEQIANIRATIEKYNTEIKKQNKKKEKGEEGKKDENEEKKGENLKKVGITLGEYGKKFTAIAKETTGAASDILKSAGDIATSTSSMITHITAVTNQSGKSMEATGKTATKTLSTIDKASAILLIISAAIQVMQKINALFSSAEKEYEKYAKKKSEIAKLTEAMNEYAIAVLKAAHAEDNWFAKDKLKALKEAKEINHKAKEAYFAKLNEEQAVYKNKSSGGWATGALGMLTGQWFVDQVFDTNLTGRDYKKSTTEAKNNLRIETRKRKKGFLGSGIGGKSQKTEDLSEWIDRHEEFGGAKLFDEAGFLNKNLAQNILDNFGNKLVGQTKETLEALLAMQKQYDEYQAQLKEYVSSLYSPLVDNFVSGIWASFNEGTKALEAFKKNASETFRSIANDMIRTLVMNKVFDGFSEKLAKIYDEHADGALSDEELITKVTAETSELMRKYEAAAPAIEGMLTAFSNSLGGIGINLKEKDNILPTATKGALTTVTQDVVSRVEGTFLSLQTHAKSMDDQMVTISNQTSKAVTQLMLIAEHTSYCRHLAQIREVLEKIERDGILTK
ncbi:hypothetical protein D0T50_09790 [Bacteroides sp. 214]|uniref:hypothetical protein n=1 Tax=Bacteroides sp. 214 TaxID=2302935 RepID=UPI0013D25D59|nr:hypothetical protein [Bacteroides sp. 214]NDW13185.1 hypothetical protein [Bacteroides sp. 214]